MLIGQFQHNIDVKGRVFIPAKLREDLGENFVVTKGLDGCLFLYSGNEWKRMEEILRGEKLFKSRNLQRYFFSSAAEVQADKQGRALLPQNLREHAGLEKDVVIIGASTRAEIWDKEKWETLSEGLTDDAIAQAMDELGF